MEFFYKVESSEIFGQNFDFVLGEYDKWGGGKKRFFGDILTFYTYLVYLPFKYLPFYIIFSGTIHFFIILLKSNLLTYFILTLLHAVAILSDLKSKIQRLIKHVYHGKGNNLHVKYIHG